MGGQSPDEFSFYVQELLAPLLLLQELLAPLLLLVQELLLLLLLQRVAVVAGVACTVGVALLLRCCFGCCCRGASLGVAFGALAAIDNLHLSRFASNFDTGFSFSVESLFCRGTRCFGLGVAKSELLSPPHLPTSTSFQMSLQGEPCNNMNVSLILTYIL